MSRKFQIRNQEELYFITFTVIHWIDVFIRRQYRDVIIDSLKFCQDKKGLILFAYCIMSSHVHLITGTAGKNKLQDIIRDFKKFTAMEIIRSIQHNFEESRKEWLLKMFREAGTSNSNNTRYQFWQQHNHPVELNTNKMIEQRLDYIHNNPVEAGIVTVAENYLYSSAVNYAGLPEILLDVILIED